VLGSLPMAPKALEDMSSSEQCTAQAWVMSLTMDTVDRYLVGLVTEGDESDPESEVVPAADVRALMDEDTAEALVALRGPRVRRAVAQKNL